MDILPMEIISKPTRFLLIDLTIVAITMHLQTVRVSFRGDQAITQYKNSNLGFPRPSKQKVLQMRRRVTTSKTQIMLPW
jgi:hypothetical protein